MEAASDNPSYFDLIILVISKLKTIQMFVAHATYLSKLQLNNNWKQFFFLPICQYQKKKQMLVSEV